MLGVDHQQQSPPRGLTHGNEAHLSARRIRVWEGGRQRIVEDADCLIECDLVLPAIGLCLNTVLFEVHRLAMAGHGGV